uniref:Uncharacterized protein n=1 Tax=Cucumis melo TaxID=3656 RepID=A0A9I9CDA4_CUCME
SSDQSPRLPSTHDSTAVAQFLSWPSKSHSLADTNLSSLLFPLSWSSQSPPPVTPFA